MATNGEFSTGNKTFGLGILGLVIVVIVLWLAFHPNSPLRRYTTYVVYFPQIGTLEPDNGVQVHGIHKGKIAYTEMAPQGGVYVTIHLDPEIRIPRDSRFRVINTGLLGQREVDITLGSQNRFYEDGDSLAGSYDWGSTRLAYLANELLVNLDSLLQIARESWYVTLGDSNHQKILHKLKQHGKLDVQRGRAMVLGMRDSLQIAKQTFQQALVGMHEQVHEIQESWSSTSRNIQEAETHFQDLSRKTKQLVLEFQRVAEQLQGHDNAIGALLNDPDLRQEIEATSMVVQELVDSIRVNGLDLNVDIF